MTTSEVTRDLAESTVRIGGVKYPCTVTREQYHRQDKSGRW